MATTGETAVQVRWQVTDPASVSKNEPHLQSSVGSNDGWPHVAHFHQISTDAAAVSKGAMISGISPRSRRQGHDTQNAHARQQARMPTFFTLRANFKRLLCEPTRWPPVRTGHIHPATTL